MASQKDNLERPGNIAECIVKDFEKTPLTRTENKIIDLASYIKLAGATEENNVGFSHVFIQTMLPHSNTKDSWFRSNGRCSVIIQPGVEVENGEVKHLGIPYGTIPRLLMLWITSEAIKTRHYELHMGNSLKAFMQRIGIDQATGGRWGTITRFKDQTKRLLNARIRVAFNEIDQGKGREYIKNLQIADEYTMIWDLRNLDQCCLFDSIITLNKRFYEELMEHSAPVDLRVVEAIKQSPLALDLYTWLTYRMSRLNKPTYISWSQLHQDFGANYADPKHFAQRAKTQLTKILQLYPAKVQFLKGRLHLRPSPTHIPRLSK